MNWNMLGWGVPLLIVIFLWTLNEFLRGSARETVSGVLALLMWSFVGLSFYISGWILGVSAILGSFVLINVFRPIAQALAHRLIAFPRNPDVEDYNRRQLAQLKSGLGTEEYWKQAEEAQAEEEEHKAKVVGAAMRNRAIAAMLEELEATQQDLEALYERSELRSVPPRMREMALANVHLIRFFLENSDPATGPQGEYVRNLSGDAHIELQLWVYNNPGGKKPN